ncbi:CPBP family intramembrane metalloprotease [Isoptericola sp. S6320L]|uniref:CPBP family intramembrane glutamic endopeptidase n=1 Tax=Isoptericola sp. S6320L TaxID=2926411 RepID=UPI001FF59C5B|nr:CPBP family intramembrane glutamic endopeptidase [Isoptericola sp. S6320L]MCK0118485.1 CPBP family intramembrane metalloprotease [Isoptericola sp. S6320L]
MHPSTTRPAAPSRAATVATFVGGVAACFVALPLIVDVFSDHGPGVLVLLAVGQLVGAVLLVGWWLRRHRLGWRAVGADRTRWRRDALLGAATVPPRALLEFGVLVPLAGGASNAEVQEVLRNVGTNGWSLAGALVLGMVGGGIAEELYFRGFLVGGVPRAFRDRRRARRVAVVVSVVLFAALHLPANVPDVVSILVAALVYTVLFTATDRLTAPMVAHLLWNATAIVGVLALYG